MESLNQLTNQNPTQQTPSVQNVQPSGITQQLSNPLDYVSQEIIRRFVQTITQQAFPIGSIFISVVATDPSLLLGYGTWSAFAQGRTLVGLDTGDIDFDSPEESGGIKAVSLSVAEMPQHSHTIDAGAAGAGGLRAQTITPSISVGSVTTGDTGSGDPHTNMPPYIVVYMWKRDS